MESDVNNEFGHCLTREKQKEERGEGQSSPVEIRRNGARAVFTLHAFHQPVSDEAQQCLHPTNALPPVDPEDIKIDKVLREFTETKDYTTWNSKSLPLQCSLPIRQFLQKRKDLKQILFLAPKKHFVLITLYSSQQSDLDAVPETKQIAELSRKTVRMLMTSLMNFCHEDIVLLSCCIPREKFCKENLEKEVTHQASRVRRIQGGRLVVGSTVFGILKEAIENVIRSSPVYWLLQEKDDRLLLLNAASQNILWYILELLSHAEEQTPRSYQMTYDDVTEEKWKIVVLEAARRLSFQRRVTVVSPDPKIRQSVERIAQQIRKVHRLEPWLFAASPEEVHAGAQSPGLVLSIDVARSDVGQGWLSLTRAVDNAFPCQSQQTNEPVLPMECPDFEIHTEETHYTHTYGLSFRHATLMKKQRTTLPTECPDNEIHTEETYYRPTRTHGLPFRHARSLKKQRTNKYSFLLVGKCGEGKSSTANTILGTDKFSTGRRLHIPKKCKKKTGYHRERLIEVVDSPEFTARCIYRGFEKGKPFEAVCYIINSANRFTHSDFHMFEKVKEVLGPKAVQHMIVIFTHGDLVSVENIESAPEELHQLLQECGHRHVIFDNTTRDPDQVDHFFREVDKLVEREDVFKCPESREMQTRFNTFLVKGDGEERPKLMEKIMSTMLREFFLHHSSLPTVDYPQFN